jgi:hypothetical protein
MEGVTPDEWIHRGRLALRLMQVLPLVFFSIYSVHRAIFIRMRAFAIHLNEPVFISIQIAAIEVFHVFRLDGRWRARFPLCCKLGQHSFSMAGTCRNVSVQLRRSF